VAKQDGDWIGAGATASNLRHELGRTFNVRSSRARFREPDLLLRFSS
jgi:hypothetical protein